MKVRYNVLLEIEKVVDIEETIDLNKRVVESLNELVNKGDFKTIARHITMDHKVDDKE